MPHKEILFRSEARAKVLRGAALLADAVRGTLGPRARSVLIERRWGRPFVCDDGVTIVKEAAERTGDVVGDGTTTSTLLAYAIFADGVRNVTAGAGRKEKAQVASISAHGDTLVGEMVADAVERVGSGGVP